VKHKKGFEYPSNAHRHSSNHLIDVNLNLKCEIQHEVSFKYSFVKWPNKIFRMWKKGARRVKLFRNIFRLLSHYCFLCTDTSQISRERTFFFPKRRRMKKKQKFSASQNYCKWNEGRRNGGIIEERKIYWCAKFRSKNISFYYTIE